MASQILGLDPLDGYLKHGNYVVGCGFLTWSFPYSREVHRAEDEGGRTSDMPPPVVRRHRSSRWNLSRLLQARSRRISIAAAVNEQTPFFE